MSFKKLFILYILCVSTIISGESNIYLEEIRSLSELPMNKLIQIKSSLSSGNDLVLQEPPVQATSRKLSLTLPVALPLKRSSKNPMRRHEHYYDDKGKDTKISKIFQLAVTALSFLAFGGYLLTLIISAIRRSSNGMGNGGNVIVFSNLQSLQKYKRPKRNLLIYDQMENDFDTDRLYHGMIMLSNSYAKYN